MDNQVLEKILEIITCEIGIVPKDSHKTGILNFVDKRCGELSLKKEEYYDFVKEDSSEFELLINAATVNETYFFREEAQYSLLKEKILPELKNELLDKDNLFYQKMPLRLWSAATASGEEIYSLYLLCKVLGIKCECTASDVNTKKLVQCKTGAYKPHSCRTSDGASFHHLLKDFKMEDESILFPPEICSEIKCRKINLFKMKGFPISQHIIFVRNVFIYFDFETRKKVLSHLVNESLLPGGYLFVSMNEVASLDLSILPNTLEKKSDGKVFYFQKKKESGRTL
mgnify:CR=1 FL=1